MTRWKFVIRPRAQAQARAARAWWRRNRHKPPTAFDDELDRALELLLDQPFTGTEGRDRRGHHYRRILLERVRYYIYYRVADDLVEILAIWHASRRPPRL